MVEIIVEAVVLVVEPMAEEDPVLLIMAVEVQVTKTVGALEMVDLELLF